MLDPNGERVGRVRDVVIQTRLGSRAPRVKGLVVELFALRLIFFPIERVRSIDANEVIASGIVNTRRFQVRDQEMLVVDNLFDRTVKYKDGDQPSTIFDIAIKRVRTREWEISEVALRTLEPRRPFQRGHVIIVDWTEIPGFFANFSEHSPEDWVRRLGGMKSADVARELHDMDPARRAAVVRVLDNETLAEAMEELPEDEQVEVLASLDSERAADVLEEMDPDDAADLIAELDENQAKELLRLMAPEDAENVRTLLAYGAATAGGLMNPEPVILAADATVAEALASLREPEVTPAMAAVAFVCRSPLDTPTGRYLGAIHIQRLLREPPSILAAGLIDPDVEPLSPQSDIAHVARYFATYDLVCAPVLDSERRLLGVVTVDDVLDHILPDDWRGAQLDRKDVEVSDE